MAIKNYIHNELKLTKDDIKDVVRDLVREYVQKYINSWDLDQTIRITVRNKMNETGVSRQVLEKMFQDECSKWVVKLEKKE